MAEYQVIDKIAHDAELRSIGDSIRAKGGTTAPFHSAAEMKAAVDAIQTGGGGTYEVVDNILSKQIKMLYSPTAIYIGPAACKDWPLTDVDLPNCKEIAWCGFTSCVNLVTVKMPNVERLVDGAFWKCSKLKKLDFHRLSSMLGYNFARTEIDTMIIRTETICTASKADNFDYCPIGNGTGYVYVPKALVEQYKTATNWVKISDQIRAIEDYPDITGG